MTALGFTGSANGTAQNYRAGGTLTLGVNTTDVGNVTTGEDNLMTFILAAGLLAVDGDRVEIEAAFAYAATADTKTLKFYFGTASQYSTGALAINSGTSVVRATVIRTSATTQRVLVTAGSDNVLLTTALMAKYATAAETLSGAITIKFTGEATSTNDIIQKIMITKFFPAIT